MNPIFAAHLRSSEVGGWLICDYAGSNPVLARLLREEPFLTRRAFLLITPDTARLLVSRVDAVASRPAVPDYTLETYTSWRELRDWLTRYVAPLGRVAMEYSTHGDLPAVSRVDGGTIDLIRDIGVEVRSSAELLQLAIGQWTDQNLTAHSGAMTHTAAIKDLAFQFIQHALSTSRGCTEHDVQSFILDEFARRNLVSTGSPIVAVNEHSGDPHYTPTQEQSAQLQPGDWVLIDLWCRDPSKDGTFADITWVGYLGDHVPREYLKVFNIVAHARDAVLEELRMRTTTGQPTCGYELDNVARNLIEREGFGPQFLHRTGHSLGADGSLHGLTANLDDLETHDTRYILPHTGFTIEPGIYLPSFGVRSEINVYMTPAGPEVTSPIQSSPIVLPV